MLQFHFYLFVCLSRAIFTILHAFCQTSKMIRFACCKSIIILLNNGGLMLNYGYLSSRITSLLVKLDLISLKYGIFKLWYEFCFLTISASVNQDLIWHNVQHLSKLCVIIKCQKIKNEKKKKKKNYCQIDLFY